ncbi:GPI transamidase component PIG-S [Polistes fuscatus]|uniref:GPI transamidase component PIG-S n=1 Tax=Polistes fuscatus TaxID=30207 RepID=UPI001CA903D3|nr:GPI transamidase component PIG-S [Polistes fuscatus]
MEEEITTVDHDSIKDEKYRVYASISFAVILLGIGVPLWWYMTTVPRVALPYSGIDDLSNLEIRIKMKIIVAALTDERATALTEEIRRTFEDSEIYDLEVVYQVVSSNLLAFAFAHHELEKIASTFDLDVGNLLLLESPNLNDAVLVGSKRTIYFSIETSNTKLVQVLSEWILREKSLDLTKNALTNPTNYSLDEENRRRFPASSAYDVLITLVNPDPETLQINWDLQAMTEEYIEPFLDQLSMISNFSVKSQWLYFLPLSVNLITVPDSSWKGKHYALVEDVLPHIVTPLEKKLASQVSLHPCINFVAYVVSCDNAPLHIYARKGHKLKTDGDVEAFLSPRWGGVVFANPPSEACEAAAYGNVTTIVPDEATIIGIFLAQLRLLLGIPEMKPISSVTVVPLVGLKSRDWEVDALLRVRAMEQLTSAKLTLQSLAQLLTEINRIVITDVVGNRIKIALDLVERSAELLKNGDLMNGFMLSKDAFITAEEAFSDPTLLALLYFPEDQKYAVYTPLFLPAMIPVLLSLKTIQQYYRGGKTNVKKVTGQNKTNEDSTKVKDEKVE